MACAAGDSSRNSQSHSLLKFAAGQVSGCHKNGSRHLLQFLQSMIFFYQAKESQLRQNLD